MFGGDVKALFINKQQSQGLPPFDTQMVLTICFRRRCTYSRFTNLHHCFLLVSTTNQLTKISKLYRNKKSSLFTTKRSASYPSGNFNTLK